MPIALQCNNRAIIYVVRLCSEISAYLMMCVCVYVCVLLLAGLRKKSTNGKIRVDANLLVASVHLMERAMYIPPVFRSKSRFPMSYVHHFQLNSWSGSHSSYWRPFRCLFAYCFRRSMCSEAYKLCLYSITLELDAKKIIGFNEIIAPNYRDL